MVEISAQLNDLKKISIVSKTPILNQGAVEAKRQEIIEYFRTTFAQYEDLFQLLASEQAFYVQGEPLRHPLIFYYGHTAVFYINKLILSGHVSQRINEKLESMLAVGVDEMSWDDINKTHYDWPSVAEVQTYRQQVKPLVEQIILDMEFTMPIDVNSPMWVILMAIEHERIHLETSSVLIRQLPIEQVQPSQSWPHCAISNLPPENYFEAFAGKRVHLGVDHKHRFYAWDNEFGNHEEDVASFQASAFLVSNKEFLEFVEIGGYSQQSYWDEESWPWVCDCKRRQPRFWLNDESGKWKLRILAQEIPMRWDWPVEVNFHEAKAFCRFLSEKLAKPIRLPSEAEWHLFADNIEQQPEWQKAPGNINLEYFASPCPVNTFQYGRLFDVIGNVWQWTETPIAAFNNFKVHPLYDDFSTPTFDGKHNIVKGGSWISTGNEALTYSRYAFRRHFYQHAGFRYVQSESQVKKFHNTYETDTLVSQYIEFHYGASYLGVPNFPLACVEKIASHVRCQAYAKALDIGCAVGRSAFELSRYFQHVDAVDFSARFISVATHLQQQGKIQYQLQDEGELQSYHQIVLADFIPEDSGKNISFMQADACNLPEKYHSYDLVFAGNLLDRLYDPLRFLTAITERINSKGFLVLTSPYTWLEEFTDKDNWLGGKRGRDGEILTTLHALRNVLSKDFRMYTKPVDIPFVIRETRRKFQHTVAEMTLWQKN